MVEIASKVRTYSISLEKIIYTYIFGILKIYNSMELRASVLWAMVPSSGIIEQLMIIIVNCEATSDR